MTYLTADEVIRLHDDVILQSGGAPGFLDRGKIESAVSQPRMSFGGQDLYTTLAEKAAALGYSLANNHGFVDGNKRIAHAAMESFLVLNGYELNAPVDVQEALFLQLASGILSRPDFTSWVQSHLVRLGVADSQ